MKVLRWLDKYFEETVMMIFLAALSCAMMLQIISRFIFQHALPWPEEFCRYCFVYSVMLARAGAGSFPSADTSGGASDVGFFPGQYH